MNSLKVRDKSIEIKLEHLAALYPLFNNNGDFENAEKILDLYEKLEHNELVVSFAGHFSAGKSSMINALMGEDILPKSPIPTSANVVKINSGGGYARVHLHSGDILEFEEPYDMDLIKDYSKDKDTIKKIEISTKKLILPENFSVMDTPGIDAADDADRIMTESSLHLVDVMFYVMDYNHVQSEVNLQFLQSIQKKQIPFYVIVNQIDKHDETELSFQQFKQSIELTFQQWNVLPEQIFYTSLLDKDVKHNQFKEVQETLAKIMNQKSQTIQHSVFQVIENHEKYLNHTYDNQLDGELNDADLDDGLEEMYELNLQLNTLQKEVLELESKYNQDLQSTLNNAYLMPAVLRDKANDFLESQQSNFKIGLFGSKKKTSMEKEKRLAEFLQPLQENIEASIQWKLRDKFSGLIKNYEIADESIKQEIQSLKLDYEEKDLIQLINTGAKVNGDYVLNYTKEVANDIKTKYRKIASQLLSDIKQSIEQRNNEKESKLKERLSELEYVRDYKDFKDHMEIKLNEDLHMLKEILENPILDESAWNQVENALNQRTDKIKKVKVPKQLPAETTKFKKVELSKENKGYKQQLATKDVVTSIEKVIQTISNLPGFDILQRDLNEKKRRLSNRSYTIALFGAFSAGKSSFANALIGENALPVSPNPTTATVNRICPVTDDYQHGTVVVMLKDEEALMNDLLMITKKFSPKESDLQSFIHWVKDKKIYESPKLNKMYQSYLLALVNGYSYIQESIGKRQTITLEEFGSYVTDETKACYIESINLYYDCSLTRQGITLVDTPGADSVNARHTNVAFEYIKHADAILYVTYYNHALSRADRDFLMQLGRVKEAFQLDKMFFIVNAADLARDDEELSLVVQYVGEQLLELGVRLPRLYPVSSKQSLKEKQNKDQINEQMSTFEESFYQFIHYDLTTLTVESALWDMQRTYHKLGDYIDSMNLDEDSKRKRKEELHSKKQILKKQMVNVETSTLHDQIRDKMDKQLYYVLERLQIRFHDMFKEHFNPTTVTESGRKAISQLRNNLESLIEYVGFELIQELQAVSLRIEAYIQQQGNDFYESIKKQCIHIDQLFELPNWQEEELKTPDYKGAFTDIDWNLFHKAISSFKGTKAFFEKNEKEQMKEAIFDQLSPLAKNYIEENKQVMFAGYIPQWEDLVEKMKQQAILTSDLQVKNYEAMMNTEVNISELKDKQKIMETELRNHGIEEVS
ncbi:dynamin family protein [Oceanobacillus sp. Castelsardo]|uniref:dynamin family protein n=1 Tax=Oceanobacillus sp. Castelsardo TaxID=1851204 RepID=UPI0008387636|nr:dynamin family protein [Oceanobacillus sp. Castelsardo]